MPPVNMEDIRVITELRQEPWVSKHVLWNRQDNHVSAAAKKVRPLGSKAGECGNEDKEE